MRFGIIALFTSFIIIAGAVVLISLGRANTSTVSTNKVTKISEYATNPSAKVSWTMQGRLVGDDEYKSVRVSVTSSSRKVEILSGYEERVEKTTEFPNNPEAFATFSRALDNLSFGQERKVAIADERGVCPQGNRFIYRLTDGAKEVIRTWSDSCGSKDGPYGGKTPAIVRDLFTKQITDYNKFVSGIRF